MADSDPNRPRDFEERFRDQVHEDILARHRAKMERRMDRMQRRMDRKMNRPHSPFGGLLIGVILAGVGVLLLLQNLGISFADEIWDWWPAILILMGGARVATAYGWGGRVFGGILIFAGTILLLHNLGFIHGDPWNFFWPVILIAIGVSMLARHLDRDSGLPLFVWWPPRPMTSAGVPDADSVSEYAFFGGVRRRVESQNFQGGDAAAMFGGINLDLTRAGIQKEEIRLEANAMFGGIDIRVPDTWHVVVRGTGIFGGYEDKTWSTKVTGEDKRPRLIITGFAIFGGVNVKTV